MVHRIRVTLQGVQPPAADTRALEAGLRRLMGGGGLPVGEEVEEAFRELVRDCFYAGADCAFQALMRPLMRGRMAGASPVIAGPAQALQFAESINGLCDELVEFFQKVEEGRDE